MDVVNVGRRVSFEGLRLAWQAQNPHHGSYLLTSGLKLWEGLHFWNLSLRMLLCGQCSISYDLGS